MTLRHHCRNGQCAQRFYQVGQFGFRWGTFPCRQIVTKLACQHTSGTAFLILICSAVVRTRPNKNNLKNQNSTDYDRSFQMVSMARRKTHFFLYDAEKCELCTCNTCVNCIMNHESCRIISNWAQRAQRNVPPLRSGSPLKDVSQGF